MLPTILPSVDEDTLLGGVPLQVGNSDRGQRLLAGLGYDRFSDTTSNYMAIYEMSDKKGADKRRAEFVAGLLLQTLDIVKISEVEVYYVKARSQPLYMRCPSKESLASFVAYIYQLLFGFRANIQDAVKYLLAGITHRNLIQNIERRYIGIALDYCWDKKNAEIYRLDDLPPHSRVFAKMFDTEYEDDEVFKVPPLNQEQMGIVSETYYTLRNTPYDEWPDDYHFQCFKDWSENRPDVEFGMFTILALPFMHRLPRGAFFNVGEGHNGKSVLVGLAVSILGKNNASFVSGNDLSSWDYVVDLQTTFLNCPNETKVDFLKDDTDVFKALSAHETTSSRVKHQSASVPIVGDFPMVFNLNKLPDFGSDASAILSRMFVNDFDCDFEATGRAIKDYARKTFLSNPNTIPTLVGMIFAFCYYYNSDEHPWEPKPAMVQRRESIREIATPYARYLHWFSKFFNGFTKISTLKNDYIQFGRAEGEEYDTSMIKLKELPFKRYKRCSMDDGSTVYQDSTNKFDKSRHEWSVMDDTTYIRAMSGDYNLYELNHVIHESLVYKLMTEYLRMEQELTNLYKIANNPKTPEELDKLILEKMDISIKNTQYEIKNYRHYRKQTRNNYEPSR